MISLIRNEFIKIFKKKSIYITLLIIIALVILINAMYHYATNSGGRVYSDIEEKQNLTDLELDEMKNRDINEYIGIKTGMEMEELRNKYDDNSWQVYIIDQNPKIHECIYDVNRYTYGVEKDEELLAIAQSEYNRIIEILDNDDWKYFAQTELVETRNRLDLLKQQKDETGSTDIEMQIFQTELDIEVLELRISRDIKYVATYDYLNDALNSYRNAKNFIKDYESGAIEDTYVYKQEYYGCKEELALNKYMIDNKVNLYETNLRMTIMDVFNSYDLFIIILIVMVAGSIVSDEFSKGTVKLWLVRPHTRTKLLLAKFITAMLMILIVMIVIASLQFIIGGITFGFESLQTPAVVYDFNNGELLEINIFRYIIIQGFAILPFFILIATIAFAISTIFANSALAITIAMLGYISSDIINAIVYQFDIQFMKYFITMNWHLDMYLFGRLPGTEDMSFGFSAVMCVIYFLILTVPTFIVFKKKNIKNV